MNEPTEAREIAERFVLQEMMEPLQIPAGRVQPWIDRLAQRIAAALAEAREEGVIEGAKAYGVCPECGEAWRATPCGEVHAMGLRVRLRPSEVMAEAREEGRREERRACWAILVARLAVRRVTHWAINHVLADELELLCAAVAARGPMYLKP